MAGNTLVERVTLLLESDTRVTNIEERDSFGTEVHLQFNYGEQSCAYSLRYDPESQVLEIETNACAGGCGIPSGIIFLINNYGERQDTKFKSKIEKWDINKDLPDVQNAQELTYEHLKKNLFESRTFQTFPRFIETTVNHALNNIGILREQYGSAIEYAISQSWLEKVDCIIPHYKLLEQ